MTTDPHQIFDNALDELRRTQDQLATARKKLQAKPAKAMSKDGMVTVGLDERGDVTSISFNTAKFRRMAPAELGSVLVETIKQARAKGREAMMSAYRPLMPPGLDLDQIMSGKFSTDGMFSDARKRVAQIRAETEAIKPSDTRKG